METVHHTHSKVSIEQYSFTLVARLHHYVSRYQRDRDTHIPQLIYAYHSKTHRAMMSSPHYVILLCKSPSAAVFHKNPRNTNDIQRYMVWQKLLHRLLHQLELMRTAVSLPLSTAQRSYSGDFHKNIRLKPAFQVWEYIFKEIPN